MSVRTSDIDDQDQRKVWITPTVSRGGVEDKTQTAILNTGIGPESPAYQPS